MVTQVVTIWNSFYTTVMKVPFIFYLILIAIYFWINGAAHFPNWDQSYSSLILPYIVMMMAFYMWARTRAERAIETPSSIGIVGFVGGFFATWVFMTVAISFGLFEVPDFDTAMILQTIILQVCVIATAEELMFRGVLLNAFGRFGLWISAFLFAIWHSYAYQVSWYNITWQNINIMSLGIAFAFGIILGIIAMKKELGLPACIGIHAAFNLAVLGVLVL